MKLLSLNLWGATQGSILFEFLDSQAKDMDIFCFQEVFNAPLSSPEISNGNHMRLFSELQQLLKNFQGQFCPVTSGHDYSGPVNFAVQEGLAIFVKKSIEIESFGDNYIYGDEYLLFDPTLENLPNKLQHTVLNLNGKILNVINVHGHSRPGDKRDTPERLRQSEIIKNFVKALPGAQIICGDFNLMPDTQSIKMLEGPWRNLIKDFNIQDTRNNLSRGTHADKQYFADYTFISEEIKVKNFQVPYNEVSDHLPMILEFEL